MTPSFQNSVNEAIHERNQHEATNAGEMPT